MIWIFGVGPSGERVPLWAFGIGLSAENGGKTRESVKKNNASGNIAVFGLFWGPWLTISSKKRSPCFEMFPLFVVFLFHVCYFRHVFSL